MTVLLYQNVTILFRIVTHARVKKLFCEFLQKFYFLKVYKFCSVQIFEKIIISIVKQNCSSIIKNR